MKKWIAILCVVAFVVGFFVLYFKRTANSNPNGTNYAGAVLGCANSKFEEVETDQYNFANSALDVLKDYKSDFVFLNNLFYTSEDLSLDTVYGSILKIDEVDHKIQAKISYDSANFRVESQLYDEFGSQKNWLSIIVTLEQQSTISELKIKYVNQGAEGVTEGFINVNYKAGYLEQKQVTYTISENVKNFSELHYRYIQSDGENASLKNYNWTQAYSQDESVELFSKSTQVMSAFANEILMATTSEKVFESFGVDVLIKQAEFKSCYKSAYKKEIE